MSELTAGAWVMLTKYVLPLLPGAAGAGLSLAFLGKELSRSQKFTSFAFGLVCAMYAAPALVEFMAVHGEHMTDFIKFTTGLFGMSICREIFAEINSADIIGTIKRRYFGGDK